MLRRSKGGPTIETASRPTGRSAPSRGQRARSAVGPSSGSERRSAVQACVSEPDAKTQINFTDPQSGLTQTRLQQCHNARLVEDRDHRFVAATDRTVHPRDQRRLSMPFDDMVEAYGERPKTVLADAGVQ